MALLATYIIIDVEANDGSVGLFWSRISKNFLKPLYPFEVAMTRPERPTADVVKSAIADGNRKIVILGDQQTIFEGVNELMRYPESFRKNLEIGLWPLHLWEMVFYAFQPAKRIQRLAKIFKVGHTCMVDLGRIDVVREDETQHSLYFWQHCQFSIFATESTQEEEPVHKLRWYSRLSSYLVLPRAVFQVEFDNFHEVGALHIRIGLHKGPFCSLKIKPEELKRKTKFRVGWQQRKFLGGRWFPTLKFPWNSKKWMQKKLKGQCQEASICGLPDSIGMSIDSHPERVFTGVFKIETKALPIIIQIIPAHSKSPVKHWLAPFKPVKATVSAKSPFSEPSKYVGLPSCTFEESSADDLSPDRAES